MHAFRAARTMLVGLSIAAIGTVALPLTAAADAGGAVAASPDASAAGGISKSFVALTPGDGGSGDEYGDAVSISGTTAVVGAWKHDSTAGAAYVYVRSTTGTWSQQAELTEPGGETAGDYFGDTVAVAKNIIVVGAFGHNSGAGTAYIFERVGTTWTEKAQLTGSDTAAGDGFGVSVALTPTTVVVGANSHNNLTGAAYVFTKSGATWPQTAELTASDGQPGDTFGTVAISGSLIVVGAYGHNNYRGAAYVFAKGTGTAWNQQQELVSSDGIGGDDFGISVAISGTSALIGASGHNNNTGSAYVFTQSGSTWTQQTELTASNGAGNELFGGSVALSGTKALVADGLAYFSSDAYVYAQTGSTWPQIEILKRPATAPQGWAPVALSGTTAIIGSWGYGTGTGAAYVN